MSPWGLRMGSAACGREAKSLPQGGTLMTTGWKWVLGIAGVVGLVWACNSWANDAVEEERRVSQFAVRSSAPMTTGERWTVAELYACTTDERAKSGSPCEREWAIALPLALQTTQGLPFEDRTNLNSHWEIALNSLTYYGELDAADSGTGNCSELVRWIGDRGSGSLALPVVVVSYSGYGYGN